LFFPFAYFLSSTKKVLNLLKACLFGGTIISILATINFIKNYDEWAHPVGFSYPRVTAILTVQDFANIMCLVLLFLLSFLFFYKNIYFFAYSFVLLCNNAFFLIKICCLLGFGYICFELYSKYLIYNCSCLSFTFFFCAS